MTGIWVAAQLSPALATWINRTHDTIRAQCVRAVNLRDAGNDAGFWRSRLRQERLRTVESIRCETASDALHPLA